MGIIANGCTHEIDLDANCGIIIIGNAIGWDRSAAMGDGLQAGVGTCEMEVKADDGIEVGPGGVKVKADCHIIVLPAGVSVDVDSLIGGDGMGFGLKLYNDGGDCDFIGLAINECYFEFDDDELKFKADSLTSDDLQIDDTDPDCPALKFRWQTDPLQYIYYVGLVTYNEETCELTVKYDRAGFPTNLPIVIDEDVGTPP